MYQQVIIVGNVGRDPEMRYTSTGIAVCDFSVAVNRRVKDESAPNGRRDETTWFRVTAWRTLAELCSQYIRKGRQIMIIGEVKASAYLDKSGQPAATLELTANDVRFIGSRDDNEAGGDFGGGGGRRTDDEFAPPPSRQGGRGGKQNSDLDDIPF